MYCTKLIGLVTRTNRVINDARSSYSHSLVPILRVLGAKCPHLVRSASWNELT